MSTQITNPEDILALSDEEVMNLDPSKFPVQEENTDENTEADEATKADADEAQAEEGNEAEEAEEAQEEQGNASNEAVDSYQDGDDEVQETKSPKASKQSSEESKETVKDKQDSSDSIDYKAVYERIFAPFKANGRDISVGSVEDVVALMQMGANYNKKMAALKPNLKILKLLENNNLLNEEKLSFFIDLDKKNPEAIQKLLKDSDIDPLDIDTRQESKYKPTIQQVDDKQLELDEILEEIQDTPTFSKVVNVVQREWDVESRRIIAENPDLLRTLNSHIASGVYEMIADKVASERTFGRLKGMSDLQAYKAVGDAIHQAGGFAALAQKQQPSGKTPANVPPASVNKVPDTGRNEKRRAASLTTAAPKVAKEPDFNPLALSDEEFSKLMAKKYF